MQVPARTIICVFVSSLLADSVVAGISAAPMAHTVFCNPSGRVVSNTPTLPPAETESRPTAVINVTLCGDGLSPLVELSGGAAAALRTELALARAGDRAPDQPALVPLPPGPGSASLVACGLALLGAVGGLRSLRRAHLGALPEWYSTSGPRQIGCATPLDLESPVFLERAFETVDPAVTLDSVEPLDVDLSPQLGRITLARPRAPPGRR